MRRQERSSPGVARRWTERRTHGTRGGRAGCRNGARGGRTGGGGEAIQRVLPGRTGRARAPLRKGSPWHLGWLRGLLRKERWRGRRGARRGGTGPHPRADRGHEGPGTAVGDRTRGGARRAGARGPGGGVAERGGAWGVARGAEGLAQRRLSATRRARDGRLKYPCCTISA